MVTGKGNRKEDRYSSTREAVATNTPPVSMAAVPGHSGAFDGGSDTVVQPSITSAQSVQDRCPRAAASTSQ